MERMDKNNLVKKSMEEEREYLDQIKRKILEEEGDDSEPSTIAWDKISYEVNKSNKVYHSKRYKRYALLLLILLMLGCAVYLFNSDKGAASLMPLQENKDTIIEKTVNSDIDKSVIEKPVVIGSAKGITKQGNSIISTDKNSITAQVILPVKDSIIQTESDQMDNNKINSDTLSVSKPNLSKGTRKTVLNDSTLDYRELFKKRKSQ